MNDADDSSSEADLMNVIGENIPQLVLDTSNGLNQPANLLIKNVKKLYIVSNGKTNDEPLTKDDTPKEIKKKNRRNRRNRNK